MNGQDLKNILLASRPKTLPASISPVIVGLSYSYYINTALSTTTAILTALVALLLQVSTNLVNDYYDFNTGIDKDRTLGPTRVTQAGLLNPNQVKSAFLFTFTLAFALAFPLLLRGELIMIILTLCCFLAAFLYTGGPFPLSHYALGEVLAFLFFGPAAVWGTYYLQSLEFSSSSFITLFIIGIPTGLISAQIMSINNLRDRGPDSLTSKKTLLTVLPEPLTKLVPVTFFILSITMPFIILRNTYPLLLIILITPLPFLSKWRCIISEKPSKKYNDALSATGQYMFFHALILGIILVLSR